MLSLCECVCVLVMMRQVGVLHLKYLLMEMSDTFKAARCTIKHTCRVLTVFPR